VARLTFYFDRCFGKRLPEALKRVRPPFDTEWHHSSRNRFHQTMKDDDWLEICGERGWVAFSHDRKFHSIEVEAAAIKQHSVAAFCLCGSQSETWDKLGYFIRAFPRIVRTVESERPPFLYKIDTTGSLTRVKLP
jgi:PIN like domain